MNYEINIPEFEGPLDLLLHLVKRSNLNIVDISIDEITKQYLKYINLMKKIKLDIASEYLVMAAELIQMKSFSLLPNNQEDDDDFEENPKEKLINRLLEYEKYKNLTNEFKELEVFRKEVFTKEPNNMLEYKSQSDNTDYGVDLNKLLEAFSKFLEDKELEKPLNTKISAKEYSIEKRCKEIKSIIKDKKKIELSDLFSIKSKEYIVITFLAILSMSKNQEIEIIQEKNFNNILIVNKGVIE